MSCRCTPPDAGMGHSLHGGRGLCFCDPDDYPCEECDLAPHPCSQHEPAEYAEHTRAERERHNREQVALRTRLGLRIAWAIAEGRPVYRDSRGYRPRLTLVEPLRMDRDDIPF